MQKRWQMVKQIQWQSCRQKRSMLKYAGLVPLASDTFTADEWWLGQVIFTRDKQNQIAGFQVAGGRIRPVLFKRQER